MRYYSVSLDKEDPAIPGLSLVISDDLIAAI